MPKMHDPFSLTYTGMRIIESPDRPRYELPPEIMPGVPWPKGFRAEINQWAVGFLGTVNVVPAGAVYVLSGGIALMRPGDVVKITNWLG